MAVFSYQVQHTNTPFPFRYFVWSLIECFALCFIITIAEDIPLIFVRPHGPVYGGSGAYQTKKATRRAALIEISMIFGTTTSLSYISGCSAGWLRSERKAIKKLIN